MKIKIKKKLLKLKNIMFQNKSRAFLACLSFLALFLTIFSLLTKTNILSVTVKSLLETVGVYTSEIKSIEITSSNYNASGSWKVTKSAEWTGYEKARVTFDVDSVIRKADKYKDIILVVDISGSMSGKKIAKAKSDAKELISFILSDTNNRIALITFSEDSTIVSPFSNNEIDLLTKVEELSLLSTTNYNAGLLNVSEIMKTYTKTATRDCVVLFLTDGYPNQDTPNEVGTYEMLKDKYPYLMINGIQYEMGSQIVDAIKNISDEQYSATTQSLNNILFTAASPTSKYEDFIVTDYIDNNYFTLESIDDVKVSLGEVTLTTEDNLQKITWNLGKNTLLTGRGAQMTMDLTKKSSTIATTYYPTNKKEQITSKFQSETAETITSTKTPVLKGVYTVSYDTNAPTGCSLPSISSEKHFAYQNVQKITQELSCQGYLFKGWEFKKSDEDSVKLINENVYIMPEKDITLVATWSKHSLKKEMDGTVYQNKTLYRVLQNEATTGGLAKEYTGTHQDSYLKTGDEKIYHYYATTDAEGTEIQNKNNVIFANACWQMIRTTDTGGVKLLYNGEPDSNGACGTDRGTHVGYTASTTTTLGSRLASQTANYNFYYGTDYTYDNTTQTFSLTGTKVQNVWSNNTYQDLIGKYTCKSIEETGSCKTIYYVTGYYSSTAATVIGQSSAIPYSLIGRNNYNETGDSLAYFGYMYNNVYITDVKEQPEIEVAFYPQRDELSLWYSKKYTYSSTTKEYKLTNPYQITSEDEISSLVGTYTLLSTSSTATNSQLYYVSSESSTYANAINVFSMSNGNTLTSCKNTDNGCNDSYTFGDGYTKLTTGKYRITNPTTIKRADFSTNYEAMNHKYLCINATNNACAEVRYITFADTSPNQYIEYDSVTSPIKYSNSYTYSDGNYTLSDTNSVTFWDSTDENMANLATTHYTCFNDTGVCSSLYYIYGYIDEWRGIYYVELTNGKSLDEIMTEMLSADDVNTTDSEAKKMIDMWYEKHLLKYKDYIEDTIFCNNRTIKELNGWNPAGGDMIKSLTFNYSEDSSNLSCTNETDKFSINNSKARLKYPVGLMTYEEMNLLNNDKARTTSTQYYLGTPYYFTRATWAYTWGVSRSGILTRDELRLSSGVRPAISLAPDATYRVGDGTMNNPYIVETNVS